VRAIVDRVLSADSDADLAPEQILDRCLDLLGPMTVEPSTWTALLDYAEELFGRQNGGHGHRDQSVAQLLGTIAGTREYQFG
jgi:hypothetical protein